ncbi:hypothetical protein [Peribacillus frigoritolerans]|uniref:hypothetical protein n=1 Tax=Peribacillus frigoritolerans TaxID=450367 RepID=UPI00363B101A
MIKLTDLTKREFADFWEKDGSKNGSAWQKIEKEIALLCNYEKTGKNRGIRYNILEIYHTPKEQVHGNKYREPINKGAVDKTSLKYQLAELLIQLGGTDYLTKNGYLDLLGFKTGNFERLMKKFDEVKYHELKTSDQYVFKQVQNVQLALARFMDNALDLIRKETFDGVILDERLFVVFNDESHENADVLDDLEGLYSLYKQARAEAQNNVEAEYGTSLFFATRMKYINYECAELIESDDKYRALDDNGISFFYKKYAINKAIVPRHYDYEVEDYDGGNYESNSLDIENEAYDFLARFIEHRKEDSHKHINSLIKKGVQGDFLSESIMLFFADELFDFMFADCGDKFDEVYARLIEDAKEAENEQLEDELNEGMSFLPSKVDFDPWAS